MNRQLTLRVILEAPFPGVDYGLQKGKGTDYETIQKQTAGPTDIIFKFDIEMKFDENNNPNFLGSFVHGPVNGRFVYIDIGAFAGQKNTCWSRRLKIPLNISAGLIKKMSTKNILVAKIPGTKNGEPNCATVKPFDGWKLIK